MTPSIELDRSQRLQPIPCAYAVVGTEAEGVAWVKARLWTDHLRRMKGAAP